MHIKFWVENLMVRDHLEEVGTDGRHQTGTWRNRV
jgi:hypothetical protein